MYTAGVCVPPNTKKKEQVKEGSRWYICHTKKGGDAALSLLSKSGRSAAIDYGYVNELKLVKASKTAPQHIDARTTACKGVVTLLWENIDAEKCIKLLSGAKTLAAFLSMFLTAPIHYISLLSIPSSPHYSLVLFSSTTSSPPPIFSPHPFLFPSLPF